MATVRSYQPLLCFIENLNDIFLRVRPSIVNVWNEIFDKLPAEEGALISVGGKDGKSLLSLEIIAKVLMMSGSEDNAAEPEVLLLDTGRNFRILKLVMIIKENLTKIGANASDEVVENMLNKFFFQQIDNPYSHELLMVEIERALKENSNISIVVVDCLGYFYNHASFLYEPEEDGEKWTRLTKVNFYYPLLDNLKILSKRFNVTFIHVKSNYSKLKFDDRQTDILLEIADDDESQKKLIIKNRYNNEIRAVNFIIKNCSKIELIGEPEKISSYRYVDCTIVQDENNESSQDDGVFDWENIS